MFRPLFLALSYSNPKRLRAIHPYIYHEKYHGIKPVPRQGHGQKTMTLSQRRAEEGCRYLKEIVHTKERLTTEFIDIFIVY